MNFNRHPMFNSEVFIKPFIIYKFILTYNCIPILGAPVKLVRFKMKLPGSNPDKCPE